MNSKSGINHSANPHNEGIRKRIFLTFGFLDSVFRAWRRSLRLKIGLGISIVIIIMGILSPLIAPYPRDGMGFVPEDALQKLRLPPSSQHIFGTDTRGRDVFSRVLLGIQSALLQIFIVVSSSLLIGLFMGVLAAYYRGFVETLISYLIELFMSIPAIVIALALRLIIGSGMLTVYYPSQRHGGLGMVGWLTFTLEASWRWTMFFWLNCLVFQVTKSSSGMFSEIRRHQYLFKQ